MKEPKTKTPKMGRPPKHEGERLSKSRTFRVRDALDNGLQIAAKRSGRSVSEEIESRLERSFGTDGLLDMALGENVADLIQMIFMAVARSGIRTGSKHSYEVLQAAIFYIIAAFARQLVPRPPYNEVQKDGARIAEDVLESFGFTSLLEHYKWMIGEHRDKETPPSPRDALPLPMPLPNSRGITEITEQHMLDIIRRGFSPEIRALVDSIRQVHAADERDEIAHRVEAGDIDGVIEAVGLNPAAFRRYERRVITLALKAAAIPEGAKKQ
jgi:hypothetical protein